LFRRCFRWIVRYARLVSHATAAPGGIENVRSWWVAPAIAFHGECPLDIADTETGARGVDALPGRLEHGVFSRWIIGLEVPGELIDPVSPSKFPADW
jgi:hypothetical protein